MPHRRNIARIIAVSASVYRGGGGGVAESRKRDVKVVTTLRKEGRKEGSIGGTNKLRKVVSKYAS